MSQANDGVQGSITSLFANILQNIASWIWSFITGAFTFSDVDDSQWTAVEGLTSWWVVVMMTPLVVAMILQLLTGLISQQPRRLVRALVGGAVAVPLVAGAVFLVRQLTRVGDSAAAALLGSLGTDPYMLFMRLFGFEKAPTDSGREWNVASLAPGSTGGAAGAVIVTAMAVIVVWILAFILMCSMIFRSFALIVLAAVAPVALMLMPWEKTQSWVRRWCEIVVALLLAKPLAATVLAVAIKLFAESKSFAGLAAGVVGMALACGAPLMALRLVSFAGGELAAAAQTAGGGHVLSRSSGFAVRQISRQTGGRLTLAGLAGRSAVNRPVQSRRPQFAEAFASDGRVSLTGELLRVRTGSNWKYRLWGNPLPFGRQNVPIGLDIRARPAPEGNGSVIEVRAFDTFGPRLRDRAFFGAGRTFESRFQALIDRAVAVTGTTS